MKSLINGFPGGCTIVVELPPADLRALLAAEKNERFLKSPSPGHRPVISQTGLNPVHIQLDADLNLVNKGVLAEQLVGQELLQISPQYRVPELFYLAREQRTSSAEVDIPVAIV